MKRREEETGMDMVSLHWHVMDAMAGDWESIEQIRPQVLEYCGPVTDEQVFAALRRLHGEGLVHVMHEGGDATKVFPEDPRSRWFGMTEEGRGVWETLGVIYQ